MAAVDPEDLDDDELPTSMPVLPPADRLWRHPSELSAPGLRPLPAPAAALAGVEPRPAWQIALAAGLASALAVVAAVALTGGLRTRVVERPTASADSVVPVATPTGGGADLVAIANGVRASLARVAAPGGVVGSGLFFRRGGYLLTSSDLVGEADTVGVRLADGRQATGHVVAADAAAGVAVVRVAADPPGEVAPLSSAADVAVGDPVVVVGAPGDPERTPPAGLGTITGVGVALVADEGTAPSDLLQLDAPVPAAARGGVLLDRRGAVVGIALGVTVADDGTLGFATPIDIARAVADDLLDFGTPRRAWLGFEGSDLDAEATARLGVASGALVHDTVDGSPADRAGLAPDDVIVRLGDRTVRGMPQLVILLAAHDPGQAVVVGVVRDGQRHTLTVTLGDRPS